MVTDAVAGSDRRPPMPSSACNHMLPTRFESNIRLHVPFFAHGVDIKHKQIDIVCGHVFALCICASVRLSMHVSGMWTCPRAHPNTPPHTHTFGFNRRQVESVSSSLNITAA